MFGFVKSLVKVSSNDSSILENKFKDAAAIQNKIDNIVTVENYKWI